jgi:GntR family transcriptional regulator, transcriptional repressor for pyruvate dehydrogenase complex
MKFDTIQRSSTTEIIIAEILAKVKSGELRPGDKLPPEREMVRMFGVGRSSIREAVKGLVLLGYLDVIQGKGTFLKQDPAFGDLASAQLRHLLTAENIFDLMEVRQILECNAVRLATRRAAPEDLERIRKALDRMRACENDADGFYDPDFDFHMAIAEASGNSMILEMMRFIIETCHRQYAKFKPQGLCPPHQAVATAQNILDLLEKGDEVHSARAMREHLRLVEIELRRVMPGIKDPHAH